MTSEKRLAPAVDPDWANDFLLTLRAAGVSGDEIGGALTDVEAYVRDSGESALEAFGDPIDYARSLGLRPSEKQSAAEVAKVVAMVALQTVGMLIILSAFPWTNEQVGVTAGLLSSGFVIVAGMILIAWAAYVHFDHLVHHSTMAALLGGLLSAVLLGITFACARLLGHIELVAVPRGAIIALGCVVMAIGILWSGRNQLAEEPDVISGPLEERPHRSAFRALAPLAIVPGVTAFAAVFIQLVVGS